MSYAQCKGRRAFVVLPRLGQPAFLVWLISINLSRILIGYTHLHPADDSREVQPAAEVVIQLERYTVMKPPAEIGITYWGEVWVLFKWLSPCSDTFWSPSTWDGKSVPLTTIHQGAVGFEYEMCILVSILLFIMEQKSCLWAGSLFWFASFI